jgi:hypothetical protein
MSRSRRSRRAPKRKQVALARKVMRARRLAAGVMSEDDVHIAVADKLRAAGVWFFHVANQRRTTAKRGAYLKRMGVSAGVPDLVLVAPGRPPMALELKRIGGKLADKQRQWLARLGACGWLTAVTYGLDESLAQLRAWGLL